jgi:hypothetical protein
MAWSWTDVANWVEVELRDTDTDSGKVYVTADAWSRDAGVTVRVRLQNVSDGTTAGESADVTSTTPADASFVATLAVGPERYRLQVGSETPGARVFAIGMLTSA